MSCKNDKIGEIKMSEEELPYGGTPTVSYDQDPLLYMKQRDEILRAQHQREAQQRRAMHPSLEALSEAEHSALRTIQARYDRWGRINKEMLPESTKSQVEQLEGLGFIRITQDGRIIPSWVFREHKPCPFNKNRTHPCKRNGTKQCPIGELGE
jgi:hypothetical protein